MDHRAPSAGIEPATCRLGGDRSIQLSYESEAGTKSGARPQSAGASNTDRL
jgi:hypothetical protein